MKKILFFFVSSILLNTAHAQWSSETLSAKRGFVASVTFNNNVYFIGGDASSSVLSNTIDVYNPATKSWNPSITMPESIASCTAVAGDSAIYIAGGKVSSGLSNNIHIYKNGNWSTKTVTESFIYASSVHVGSKIIVCGLSTDYKGNSLDKYYMYDELTETWTSGSLSEARSDIGVATDGNIAMFAGGYNTSSDISKRIDIYNASTDTWSIDSLSTPRLLASGSYANGKFVFAGGANAGTTSSTVVDIYDGSNWTTANISEARGGAESAVINDDIYIVGGSKINIQAGSYTSFEKTIDVYNTTSNTWSTLSLSAGRTAHAVESFGNFLYVAGGLSNGFSRLSSVEIYNASSVGLEEVEHSTLSFFPNPAQNMITLHLTEEGRFVIYSLAGEQMTEHALIHGENHVDISPLKKGAYIVQFHTQNGSIKQSKLIKH